MIILFSILLAVCLIFSFIFSSADMALNTLDKSRLEKKVNEDDNKKYKLSLKLASNYEFSMSTILFGNNLANIGATTFAVYIGTFLGGAIGGTIATVILACFIILFCEFLPKALANRFPMGTLLIESPVVFAFEILFFIIIYPVSLMFKLIKKPLKEKEAEENEIDDEVLEKMVDDIEDKGILEEKEADIIRGAIDLADKEVYEIMTPRVDTFAISIDTPFDELIKNKNLFTYSRIPVYEDTIDNIIGFLPVKSLKKYILKNEEVESLRSLLKKPLYVPRNTQVMDLLNEFKEKNVHLAIIIDEYGGTDGIATMEDILELIVGDIFDENDEIDEEVRKKRDGSYIIDGNLNIEEMFDLIDFHGEFETTYETAAGFCQEFFDSFPKEGDSFVFENVTFTILKVDDFSIDKIKIDIREKDE